MRETAYTAHIKKWSLTALLLLASMIVYQSVAFPDDIFDKRRQEMVEKDIKGRGVKDALVINAMLTVPRHLFVDESRQNKAYADHPLPIGDGQTISQPYVVALMTEVVGLKGNERVLEIGTGSGYQAAILSAIVKEVYTIEIKKSLYETAKARFQRLGYRNIRTRHEDGYYGWESYAPFDVIMVTASANHIPPPLLAQLKEGGRLIIPLGSTVFYQNLTLVIKEKNRYSIKELGGVAFVPMTGQAQKK